MKDPCVHANAHAKVLHRASDPNVMTYSKEVKEDSKRKNMVPQRVPKATICKDEREKNRLTALVAYEASKNAQIF